MRARSWFAQLELCTFAGVIYLHSNPPPKQGGTSFYRLRLPNGTLGGNICPPPFRVSL